MNTTSTRRNQDKKSRGRNPRPSAIAPPAGKAKFDPELKHYAFGANLTALNTAPSSSAPALYQIVTFNNISAGDGQSERSGVKIQASHLQLRVKCAVDPNSDPSNANVVADAHVFRITVYLDRSPNGVSPTWGTVFDSVPANSAQEFDFPNVWYKKRFKLLIDEFVTVAPSFVVHDGTNFHAYGNNRFREYMIPLKHTTWYSDGTNNLSAIQQNNIGMFISCDSSSAAMPNMKFSHRGVLRYYDF